MLPDRPRARPDLEFEEDGEDILLRDVLRGNFEYVNALQHALIQTADGTRTVGQIAETLEEEFETEIPYESITAYLTRMRRNRLLVLEQSFDPEEDASIGRKIRSKLETRGLFWPELRAESSRFPPPDPFRQAVEALDDGRFAEAFRQLAAIPAEHPTQELAARMYDTAHRSYFKSKRESPAHLKMFHLFDPDAFLGRLDRSIGGFVFSYQSVACIGLLAFMAVPAAFQLAHPPPLAFIDLVLASVLGYTVAAIPHELLHGLACKHYGGRVHDMGLLLFYGIKPGAYCDVTDSYRFRSKKQKVITILAGLYWNLILVVLGIWLYWLLSEDVYFRRPLYVFILINIFALYENMIPLIPLDGYFALAELVGMENFRDRSIAVARNWYATRLFGVEAEPEAASAPRPRLMLWYGTAAALYPPLFAYLVIINMLLPVLVSVFGFFGILISIYYMIKSAIKFILLPLVRFLRFLWTHRVRVGASPTGRFSVAVLGLAIGLAFVPFAVWLEGPARLEALETLTITAGTDGFLQNARSEVGDPVVQGQPLFELANPKLERDLVWARENLQIRRRGLQILRAGERPEVENAASAAFRSARVQTTFGLTSLGRQVELERARILPRMRVDARRAEVAALTARREERRNRLARIQNGARLEDIDQATAAVTYASAVQDWLSETKRRTVARSPFDGLMTSLAPEAVGDGSSIWLRDLEGKFFSKGDPMVVLSRMDALRVQISFDQSERVGDIAIGDRVCMKFFATHDRFHCSRVARIADSSIEGRIRVETAPIPPSGLLPGQEGRARIYGKGRSFVARWLLDPLVRLLHEAASLTIA